MTRHRPQFEDVQSVLSYQLSRRGVLGAGAALSAAGVLSACSGGGGSYTDQGPKGGKQPSMKVEIGKANIPTPREKTLIVGQVEFTVFDNWNNMVPNGAPGASGFDIFVREYMFYMNLATGKLIPWLCTDYSYNDDFTELTFNFDPKAKWSDGKQLTSQDFKWTVDLLRERKDLIGGGGDLSEFVEEVDATDPHKAVLHLKKPNPRMHYGFVAVIATGFEIRPKHIWEGKDPTTFKDNPPVRTGPYTLKDAIPSQKMFVWEKNPDYWNKDNLDVKPQYVVYQSTAEQADPAALAFERAEFDVGSIDEQHAAQLRSEGYPALITTQFNDPCPRALWMNNDPKRGLIAEPKMHWAINYLIDREKMGSKVWPVEVAPAQYPWADYATNKKWEIPEVADKYKFSYDPAKAESLLDEIAPKGSDGKRMYKGKPAQISIITPDPTDGDVFAIGKLIADELKKVGVQASMRSLSGSVFDEKMQLGQFDAAAYWTCFVSWDPEQLYSDLQSDKAQPIGKNAVDKNKSRFRSDEMDQASKQLANLDPTSAEAKQPLQQALETYYQGLPITPIIQTGYPQYFNTTFWKGWPTDDNLYQVPLNWWGQFMFILGRIEATGQKAK
ncbi:MAG TPA: ABC transporter substrate-binding protein [Microlunatus sp.]